MIRAAQQPVQHERVYGPIDYLLTGIYACLSAYATGLSVGSSSAAWMFVGIIAVGTTFSFVVQWLIGEQKVTRWDGILYLAVATATLAFREDLARMVPDQPFTEQLLMTGTLAWMMALGSFFTWRDGTLLFQAVPSIALFGMVGAFDTYKPAPALFFAFLVCLATLFARAHRRQMIEQAEASGYKAMLAKEEAGEVVPGGARLKAILEGPWKWMAGPEWALASALAIVLISLAGAPALRLVLKPIAGSIRVPQPPLTRTRTTALLGGGESQQVQIGGGPQNLSNRPVLIADTDQKRYLRARTFGIYANRGWQAISRRPTAESRRNANEIRDASAPNNNSISDQSKAEIKRQKTVPWMITIMDPGIGSVPVPGEVNSIRSTSPKDGGGYAPRNDGTYRLETFGGPVPPFSGVSTVASGGEKPKDAEKDLPEFMRDYVDIGMISPRVVQLAKDVTKNATTDYEKAQAIKRAIESTCTYNLKAARVPGDRDPVEYFLFESKEGYCDLFGSAMATMARAVGIPSRYVTGFFPIRGAHPPNSGAWLIGESEAHAWAELYFKDVGWVEFDATENAAEVPNEGRGDPTDAGAFYKQAWFKRALDVAIALVIIGGGLLAWALHRRASRSRVVTRDDIGREYARFVALLQKLSGRRRLPSHTPDEFLNVSEDALGNHKPHAEELNGRFVEALFSPMEISPAILKELRDGTESLRREIRSNGKSMAGSSK